MNSITLDHVQACANGATPEPFKSLLARKSTKVLSNPAPGRTLYEVQISASFRAKHFVYGLLPRAEGLELKEKSSVTGCPYDAGYILIDNRGQVASRKAPTHPAAAPVASPSEAKLTGLEPTNWEAWIAGVERLLATEGDHEDAGGMILARTMSLRKAFAAGKSVRQGMGVAQAEITDPDDLAYPRMSMLVSDLTGIVRKQGYGAYNDALAKMAAEACYTANQELIIGQLVEERVGKARMDQERAKFSPKG